MRLSVQGLLALASFICAVLAGLNRVPLWVAVVLVTVWLLVQTVPLGR